MINISFRLLNHEIQSTVKHTNEKTLLKYLLLAKLEMIDTIL
jgi:hypothetical protein